MFLWSYIFGIDNMEYLVTMITTQGRTKLRMVEAASCKQAEELISDKFPTCEIVRISSDTHSLEYYAAWKKIRGKI